MNDLPFPVNESDRLKALLGYGILDTSNDKEFDRITELASLVCEVPISMISFIDDTRQWVKSSYGLAVNEASRKSSFCQYTILDVHLLEVEDTHLDDRFKESEFVKGEPYIRHYAGYPLISPDGFVLGSFCLLDTKAGKLSDNQKRALQLLADQVVKLIVDQRKKREREYFESLFELSNDLICIVDADGYFKKINPAFENLLGWDSEFLLRSSIQDLAHPDDFHSLNAVRERLRTNASTINYLHRFKTKSGSFLYLQCVATPEPETGNLFAICRNITEEKLNADRLRKSEDIFRSFFEHSPGFLCTHDLDGNLYTINSTGAALLGLSASDAPKLHLRDLIPEKHHESTKAYLKEIAEKGKATGLMTTVSINGASQVWSYNNILIKNHTGPDYVIGNAVDITQSHRLSKSMHRMQEMLLQTNQMAKVGGWEIDLKSRRLDWSEVTRQIHETEEGFVPSMESMLDFYKNDSKVRLMKAMNTAVAEGTSYDLELEFITALGRELWIRIIGNSEFVNGQCKRLFGTIQDIDQRKKSEQELVSERARLRSFVEHAPAAVAMFDKDIKYLAVSQKWLEEYQLLERNIIGMSHYEVFSNISEHWKDIHQRCLAGEIFSMEEERWRPDGWDHDQFLKWEVRPWYLFDGSVGGIMMFTHDITEDAMSKEELKEAKQQSELANIAKSEFLANMSHEIRTPLNGVIGFTDLVLKTKMSETQRQYLSIVSQSAHTLLNVINDILDFSKIEAGKLELDISKCDIYEITSQSADIISFLIQSKGLEMLLNIPDGLPRFVWADEIRLKQVLINLLSNAAKFTDQGEIELKLEVIECEPEIQGEICCRFMVRDTGIGIREEKQGKIFEAFLQEDGSTSKKYGGTGLGLTISNKLLGMMGSQLKLESTRGVGSTFYFDLKMKCEQGNPLVREGIHEIKRVLIVDDNENNRLILERMLQVLHIDSLQVKSGFEALEALEKDKNVDVVLVDYHMPDMDGLETVRFIRASQPEGAKPLKVALLSSSVDRASVNKAEGAEINYRLIKPVKLVDIIMCFTHLSSNGALVEQSLEMEPFEEVNTAVFSVLISEDNPANMFLTKTVIHKMAPNAEIIEAKDGNEAYEICKKQLPDIVFMDVQMPEMNGYEATRAIKKLPGGNNTPIIALTAGNVKGEREKCLDAGMVDFVTKPFTQGSIWEVLGRVPQFEKGRSPLKPVDDFSPVGHSSFDLAKLRSAYMDDENFIEEILNLTKQSLTENLSDLKSFYELRDLARIKATGHKLKGVAKAVFLVELANISLEIEMLTTYDHEQIGRLLFQLENEIDHLLALLEKE
jgi:PAS domain S-box-containing protein